MSAVTESEVREVHGIAGKIDATENTTLGTLCMSGDYKHFHQANLSPSELRRFAQQLYRIARRIEARNTASKP